MLALTLVPLAINIGLYALFFHYGADAINGLIAGWVAHLAAKLPPWAVSMSAWALKFLGWLALALVAAITFTVVSGIIASPFNDHLSRAAMRARMSQAGTATRLIPVSSLGVGDTIGLELKRMLCLIVGAVFAALLGLVPLMQLPAFALGAWLVAFEYFGYPISQSSKSLVPVIRFTLRHPAVSLGFGSFLLLIMLLPFTSVFYIPLAVVGGTILYADLRTPGADTHRKT